MPLPDPLPCPLPLPAPPPSPPRFAVYEELKTLASGTQWHWAEGSWLPQSRSAASSGGGGGDGGSGRQLSSAEVSLYGALSKLTAAVTTYPTQVGGEGEGAAPWGGLSANSPLPAARPPTAPATSQPPAHPETNPRSPQNLPRQVVRSRLQQRFEAGRALVYRTTSDAVVLTWRREGLAGFYKGLAPSLLRVMPQSAITLAVYESLLQWMSQDGSGGGGGEKRGGGKEPEEKPGSGGARGRGGARPQQLTDGMRPLVVAADSQAEQ
jgi:hypothetical protein